MPKLLFIAIGIFCVLSANVFAQTMLQRALLLKPKQQGIAYDIPSAEDAEKCTMTPTPDNRGFIVKDPIGNVLRLFLATGGSQHVNQQSFFKAGIEVYREMDTDGDQKMDRFRWLHSNGSRLGIDENADESIDYWKEISAEEVSAEICAALAENNAKRFLLVVISPEELAKIFTNSPIAEKTRDANRKFLDSANLAKLGKDSEWMMFRAARPGVVPAGGSFGNNADLTVYEDTVAFVQDGGENKQISIGTLIKIGENNWRVLNFPKRLSEESPAASYTFFPPFGTANEPAAGPSTANNEEMAKLIEAVQQKTEQFHRAAGQAAKKQLYTELSTLLQRIVQSSAEPADKDMWTRQLVDLTLEAAQEALDPESDKKLTSFRENATQQNNTDLAAYIQYKKIMADYYANIQDAENDPAEVQFEWLKQLEGFVQEYEQTLPAAEGLLQLATYREMTGKKDAAIRNYTKVAQSFPNDVHGKRAVGAIRRLNSIGNAVPFTGKDSNGAAFDVAQYKDNTIVLYFWASWSNPEFAALKSLQEKYARAGLRIVGVNLDSTPADMSAFLQKNPIQMPNIHEAGGLDSPPALYWGIQNAPTIILYEKGGKVKAQSIGSVADLERVLN